VKPSDRYLKFVYWSDEDQVYIGVCPDLFIGGCHGHDEQEVYKELCELVEDVYQDYIDEGKDPPEPKLDPQELTERKREAA
jgi:predicted RNase H-like HicB family nuclease